ncbi:hypothetical protein RFF05_09905 [Bengtsoniella intestinalis]|uniref:hypothetical protein n=1 Tax=Bengtsoniella intestinalis TaxID=3073143 RepID=UPI00391FB993
MNKNQQLPFQRNRYYHGKMLTSADFLAEQVYGLQKRQFSNGMLFGKGIVCGLGVYSLDDQSIMVDSGLALDSEGRELVVASTVVRKLSTITGFDSLESSQAVLCLRYQETQTTPVYAVGGAQSSESFEHNRVAEGWELVLQDGDALEEGAPISEFLTSAMVYSDSTYVVSLSLPAICPVGQQVRLDMSVQCLAEGAEPLTIQAVVKTPAFTTPDGEHQLTIVQENIALSQGEEGVYSYWMTAQATANPETILIVEGQDTHITVGDSAKEMKDNVHLHLGIQNVSAQALVLRAATRINLEGHQMVVEHGMVALATITLQRTRTAYLIEAIDEDGVRTYVETPAHASLRHHYEGYFAPSGTPQVGQLEAKANKEDAMAHGYKEPVYATGVCEVPVSQGRKGQIFFSDEILHGLGRGNVHVEVGFEYLTQDNRTQNQSRNTIYGNADLFRGENPPIVQSDKAVKVQCDRGSFVVALRLNQDTTQATASVRWVATRYGGGEDSHRLQQLVGKSIAALQPTVVLATRESHYFGVEFKNIEPCSVSYTLTEENSGSITTDGVYTAPSKEGVYEIRISCTDNPLVSTYAYAVVKKYQVNEQEGKQEGK